uniref:BUD13 homolog n=1 Tax=Anopheles triannulatus TaxID=58253 RepID=A0A2M4AN86_9DIPT
MATTKINQKEYLKRYLSNDKDKKKKKKKEKKSIGKATVRIIDDDVDFSKIETIQDDEVDLFALGEEAPQVVGIIDERPPELRAKEDFSSNKWKVVASHDGFDSTLQVHDVSGRPTGPNSSNGRTGRATQSDSDESPPRKSRRDSDESPPRRVRNDSDESPPRARTKDVRRRRGNSDESPPRNRRNDSDGESPPRRRQKERRRADSDESPPRRREKPSDKSTSKRTTNRRDSDESPPRRAKKATAPSDRHRRRSDESPPRRGRDSHRDKPERRDPDQSTQRHDSDESPPRKRRSEKSSTNHRHERDRDRKRQDSDGSPPRRGRNDSSNGARRKDRQPTLEPPVRIKQEPQSDSDLSPPRASVRRRDSDESPPRRGTTRRRSKSPAVRKPHVPVVVKEERTSRSPSNHRSSSPVAGPSRMTKTLDGKRAGLQKANAVREENERFRQREKEMFDKMSSDVTGRFAETVVRGKTRQNIEKELREEFEKRKHEEKKKEIYTRWGKGVKQADEYVARLQEAAHESAKPFARYADDADRDEYLKKQDRLGDPMLDYLRSKRKEENKRAGIPEKPTYQGAFPDNRFNIRPGYRWDGVDRSNGFEKRWFETMSKKKAGEEEAYKYSVEDM